MNEILYKHLARVLNRAKTRPGAFDSMDGLEKLDKIIAIDQSPIGRTPRSNPATYTGLFDQIRKLFAATRHWGYNKKNILIHGPGRFYTEPRFPHNGKFLEPVWHRATLDLMAALALTGSHRFVGPVVSYRAGHTLDCDAVRALYRNDLLCYL